MIAMLGMYDMPPLQDANDRFWALIRTHLGFGPDHLTRDVDMWDVWLSSDLTFAQTCGMPYRTRLHGKVQLVGTPDYGLEGCPPGYYRSIFLARKDDPRDLDALSAGTFAYNDHLSQSGWAAPLVHLAARGLRPNATVETGGHARSADAVANGRADFAALDALTWELLKTHSDLSTFLREVDVTKPTPALPYITANGQDAPGITHAVRSAIDNLSAADRKMLHLRGLIKIPAGDYLSVANPTPD
ncbi:phosphate/phosphite/phosphonate ABC transporter substrate-binding protein [Ruegeria profundi]|uniref:phosphate/phosphite/phosphonate ABC transporter substrate-binding protein n=1 Tax=Ruegeria profundi TaxID=1685378 RepID=UPI001CD27247|nr:PhnD/SsuA/transferrin family substrate-binding protein [Ruegeria profundi]MCA0928585.1 PhnD/SsuA/transferrin family substrate-binding protein [Ruegeria profundi]